MATYRTSRRSLLTLFLTVNDLLRQPAYLETLEEIWGSADEGHLTAFLASELTDELSIEDALAAVMEFFPYLETVIESYLSALAQALSTEVDTRFFRRISRTFLTFEEPWEEVLTKDDFVAYAEFREGRGPAIPPHRKLLTGFTLARSSEELEQLKNFPSLLSVAAVLADES